MLIFSVFSNSSYLFHLLILDTHTHTHIPFGNPACDLMPPSSFLPFLFPTQSPTRQTKSVMLVSSFRLLKSKTHLSKLQ